MSILTLSIFGESEIPKLNVLLSGNTIQQDLVKEDKIIFSSPIIFHQGIIKNGHFSCLYLQAFSINLYFKHGSE